MSKKAVIFINIIGTICIITLFSYLVKGEFGINTDIPHKQIDSSVRDSIKQIDRDIKDTLSIIKGKDSKKIDNNPHLTTSKIDDNDNEIDNSFDYHSKSVSLSRGQGYILNQDSQSAIQYSKDKYNTPKDDNPQIQLNSEKLTTSDETNSTKESESDSNDSNHSKKSDTNNQYNPYEWAVEWPINSDKNLTDYNNSNLTENQTIEDIIESIGGDLGNLVLIRIFKEEKRLELWMSITGEYKLLKSYKLINYSGVLGPKLSADDKQSPEGYYRISNDGLILDTYGHYRAELVFPNKFDQEHNITNGYVSIHDNSITSDGFTLNSSDMEEIYEVLNSSFANGYKAIPVHIYPFIMSEENLNSAKDSPWFDFWKNIKEGYDYFMYSHRTPAIKIINGKYIFNVL